MARALAWLLLLALSFAAAPTFAQTGAKAEARELFFSARDAMAAGDYVKAGELYQRSNDLYPAPTTSLGLARAYAQQGRMLEAASAYQTAAGFTLGDDAVDAFKTAVTDAAREGGELDKRIPRLSIIVAGTPPSVTVDDKPVTLSGARTTVRLDPGRRTVRATQEGFDRYEKTVTLAEGSVGEVEIVMTPTPTVAPASLPDPAPVTPNDALGDDGRSDDGLSGLQIAGIVIGSVGVAGLAVWGVTGIIYLDAESTVDELCTGMTCTQEGLDAVDRAQGVDDINTISLIAGGVLVVAGVTLIAVGGGSKPTVEARVSPQALVVEGRF